MNIAIIKLLQDIAKAYENDRTEKWKRVAFEKAATIIETLNEKIDQNTDCTKIPGIGASIAKTIKEFLETSQSTRLNKLLSNMGYTDISMLAGIQEMTKIPKIGFKTAQKIYQDHGVKSLKELKQAVADGVITGKLAAMVNAGIKLAETQNERMPWFQASPVAAQILKRLKAVAKNAKAATAGSLRRRADTVRDFDFVVVATAEGALEALKEPFKGMEVKVVQGGDKKIMLEVVLPTDIRRADVTLTTLESFGNNINYLTGSREFNIKMRQLALKKGLTVNEHFTVRKATGEKLASGSEKDLFDHLEINFIPPECRITGLEINNPRYTKKSLIPKDLSVIRGDLHIHSSHSDGIFSPKELATAAVNAGYDFLGITDHNAGIAGGLGPGQIDDYIASIKNAEAQVNIPLYAGLEVDIRPKGDFKLPIEELAKLNYVIFSTHLKQAENIVWRLIMAIKTLRKKEPNMPIIIAHLTGRLLGGRKTRPGAINENWTPLFKFCAANNIILEINSRPERCDIHGKLIRQAIMFGCKFAINSDAHNQIDLATNLRYGIMEARKGGLSLSDIINTNTEEVQKWLTGSTQNLNTIKKD